MSGYIDDSIAAEKVASSLAMDTELESTEYGDFQLELASVARAAKALPRRQNAESEQDFQSCVFNANERVQHKRKDASWIARIVVVVVNVSISSC